MCCVCCVYCVCYVHLPSKRPSSSLLRTPTRPPAFFSHAHNFLLSDRMDVRAEAKFVMAETEHILQEAQRWMGSFIEADRKKNSVIQQLIQRLDENQFEMDQLRRDLAAERKTRNTFQMDSDHYESEMVKLEQRVVSSCRVCPVSSLPLYR